MEKMFKKLSTEEENHLFKLEAMYEGIYMPDNLIPYLLGFSRLNFKFGNKFIKTKIRFYYLQDHKRKTALNPKYLPPMLGFAQILPS